MVRGQWLAGRRTITTDYGLLTTDFSLRTTDYGHGLLTTDYSLLTDYSRHDTPSNLQEYIFEIGFGPRKAQHSDAPSHKILE